MHDIPKRTAREHSDLERLLHRLDRVITLVVVWAIALVLFVAEVGGEAVAR